jgi:hypothetical protein
MVAQGCVTFYAEKKNGKQSARFIGGNISMRSHSDINTPGMIFFPVSYHLLNS